MTFENNRREAACLAYRHTTCRRRYTAASREPALINERNAGRISSYPILSYFTEFLDNEEIFPKRIRVAGN
jgi:hypothetical protein